MHDGRRQTETRRAIVFFAALVVATCVVSAAGRAGRTSAAQVQEGPKTTTGRANIGPAKLYYEIRGNGAPLLLLHGGLGSSADFGAIIPELARSFTVITVDRRGHGRSADTPAAYSYAGMADETKAFLDHIGVASVDVIGFSDGGVVGYHLAGRYPGLVRKLVAIGANSRPDGMTKGTLEWARTRMTVEGLAKDQPEIEKRYRAANPDPDAFAEFLRKSRDLWLRDPYIEPQDFANIRCPVLFVLGEGDAVRLDHVIDMRDRLKAGHLCVIPGSSHAVLNEKPLLVMPILLDFLRQ